MKLVLHDILWNKGYLGSCLLEMNIVSIRYIHVKWSKLSVCLAKFSKLTIF
jgi:hypothetical protein